MVCLERAHRVTVRRRRAHRRARDRVGARPYEASAEYAIDLPCRLPVPLSDRAHARVPVIIDVNVGIVDVGIFFDTASGSANDAVEERRARIDDRLNRRYDAARIAVREEITVKARAGGKRHTDELAAGHFDGT